MAGRCDLSPEGRVRPRGDASDDGSAWFMVQNTPTFRVLLRCKGVLPGGGQTRPGAPRRLIPGQGGALVGTMRTLPVISPAHQRDASDLGWTPATIVPLDLWCKIPRRPAPCNIARASSQGGGRTRPGAPRRLIPGQGGRFGRQFARLANHQPRAPEGRIQPRGDACDDCTPWFMVQDTPTPRALRRCKGVLPGCAGDRGPFGAAQAAEASSDAARRADARGSGQGGSGACGSVKVHHALALWRCGRLGRGHGRCSA